MLEIENLTAGYGKNQILCDVSLSAVEAITLVLGPNGSGKSTLIKAIVGLAEVKGGRILFHNQDITGLKPERIIRRGIGYLPQRRNLFLDLTIAENLALGRHSSHKPLSSEEIDRLFPELKPYHGKKASILSGGERQLLALARVFCSNPRLLILDEPTAGLAPAVAKRLFSLLRTLTTTALVVEQNISLALSYADRNYQLEQGRIKTSYPIERS